MKIIKFTLYVVLLVSCILMITKHPANADFWFSDRAAILEVNQQFMDAIADGDAAAVAALYTEDATLFAPNLQPLVGRDAVELFFQGAIDAGVTQAVLVTDELKIFRVRKMAYEVGNYQLFAGEEGDILVDEGPYIVIWKKVRGQWMLHRDIFNSSIPVVVPSVTLQWLNCMNGVQADKTSYLNETLGDAKLSVLPALGVPVENADQYFVSRDPMGDPLDETKTLQELGLTADGTMLFLCEKM